MASMETRGEGAKKRWTIRFYDPHTGSHPRRTFDNEADALAFKATVEVDIYRGTFVSSSALSKPFEVALTEWLHTKRNRKDHGTLLSLSRRWFGLPYPDGTVEGATTTRPLVGMPIGGISAVDIEAVLAEMKAAGRSSSYRLKAFRILDGTFKWLARAGRSNFNPCDQIEDRPSPKPRERARTVPEHVVTKMLDAVPYERDRVFIQWLLYTGTRPVEALRLHVGDVDLTANQVEVITAKGHDETVRRRTIGLAPLLIESLQPYLAGRAAEAPLFPGTANDARPMDLMSWRNNVWTPAMKSIRASFVPYDLRHTCASRLLHNGASIVEVTQWLGHEKSSTTLDTYAHLLDDKDYADRLAKLL